MADAVTTTGSMTLTQSAWERLAYFALRPELYFDGVVSVVPTNQSMPGSSVTWTFINDLAVAATPLSETTDVNAVALSDTTVTINLAEYGNAVVTTAFLDATSFLSIDPIKANEVGFNAGVSIDTVARNALIATSNVVYPRTSATKTARNTLVSSNTATPYQGDLLNAATLRYLYAKLVGTNVKPVGGMAGTYVLYAHPDQIHDLRAETGSGSWRQPHEYQAITPILTGEVGLFEGFRVVSSPRVPVLADAGGTTDASGGGSGAGHTDVYQAVAVGDEALAKVHSIVPGLGRGPMPSVFPGPVTDHLRRLTPLGWYWVGNYGIFRGAAAYRIETASSIGAN